MDTEVFGHTDSGEAVHCITIAGGGLTAKVLTWGAVIQDLRLKGHESPLVLGYQEFADYPVYSPYLGATIGRSANRIRDGELTIDGKSYELQKNFHGLHNLHGGTLGAGKRLWQVVAVGPDYVTLTIQLADGEMGFPGNLNITCTYMLESKGTLAIRMDAVTDKPTICNQYQPQISKETKKKIDTHAQNKKCISSFFHLFRDRSLHSELRYLHYFPSN